MKSLITSLTLLAASPALAHQTAALHTHGTEHSWLSAALAITMITVALIAAKARYK